MATLGPAPTAKANTVRPRSLTLVGYISSFKISPRSSFHRSQELYPSLEGPFCDSLLPRVEVRPPITQYFHLRCPVLAELLRDYNRHDLRNELRAYLSPADSDRFIIDTREALQQAEVDWIHRSIQAMPEEWEDFSERVLAHKETVMDQIVRETRHNRRVLKGKAVGTKNTDELIMEHALLVKLLNELDAPIRGSWWRFEDLLEEARRRYKPTWGQFVGDIITAPVRFVLKHLCCMNNYPSWLNPRRRPLPTVYSSQPFDSPHVYQSLTDLLLQSTDTSLQGEPSYWDLPAGTPPHLSHEFKAHGHRYYTDSQPNTMMPDNGSLLDDEEQDQPTDCTPLIEDHSLHVPTPIRSITTSPELVEVVASYRPYRHRNRASLVRQHMFKWKFPWMRKPKREQRDQHREIREAGWTFEDP